MHVATHLHQPAQHLPQNLLRPPADQHPVPRRQLFLFQLRLRQIRHHTGQRSSSVRDPNKSLSKTKSTLQPLRLRSRWFLHKYPLHLLGTAQLQLNPVAPRSRRRSDCPSMVWAASLQLLQEPPGLSRIPPLTYLPRRTCRQTSTLRRPVQHQLLHSHTCRPHRTGTAVMSQ